VSVEPADVVGGAVGGDRIDPGISIDVSRIAPVEKITAL